MPPVIPIAILAAGRATRFGGGKLDAPCAGKPLGRWVLDAVAAAGAPPGLIVVGPEAPAFARDAGREGWTLLTNPAPEAEQASSVALAARHAGDLGADALILLLADMPLVDAATIRTLIDHQPASIPLAARHRSGRPGVPARFPASLFDALSALQGDRGAAALLGAQADLHYFDLPPDTLLDVDDTAGLTRAELLLGGRG